MHHDKNLSFGHSACLVGTALIEGVACRDIGDTGDFFVFNNVLIEEGNIVFFTPKPLPEEQKLSYPLRRI